MGTLKVEMAMDSVIGEVLSRSGWRKALTGVGVFPAGGCDALEKGSNVNRSGYAYEVTIVKLEELK